jgi:hypothetical protein
MGEVYHVAHSAHAWGGDEKARVKVRACNALRGLRVGEVGIAHPVPAPWIHPDFKYCLLDFAE